MVTETEHDLVEQNFEGVSKEIVHNQIYNSRVASGLKDPTGPFLWKNFHKIVVWGLVFSLKSLVALVTELLQKDENPVKYVLTYKFLQDHLELLFSKIRHFGGWNNNPNSCICSDHFEEKCFVVRPGCEGRKLTQNAVPTIFPMFPTYYQKPMNAGRQKSPQKREYIPPQEFTPDCGSSPLKVQKDHTYSTKPISPIKNAKKVKELKK